MAVLKYAPVTASKPDAGLPIEVHGDLCLDSPSGRKFSLRAEGSRLDLAIPVWKDFHSIGPRSLSGKLRALKTAVRALRKTHLTLHIYIAGQRAVGLGKGVKPTLLARLLGLRSASIPFSSVIRLLKARAPAV